MTDSILNSTKKVLQLPEDYTAFDPDILMHINSAFATLNQLGIGPDDGFEIAGATEVWADFLGANPKLNSVKTYVALKVKMVFDPPQFSFHTNALQAEIDQYEWRLNTYRESYAWVDPDPELDDQIVVIDGGSA